MIIAQTLLAIPIAAGVTAGAVRGLAPDAHEQLRALRLRPTARGRLAAGEAWPGIAAAAAAAFGRVVSEVGAVLVGGWQHPGRDAGAHDCHRARESPGELRSSARARAAAVARGACRQWSPHMVATARGRLVNGLHISSLRAALGDIDLLVEDLQVNPGDRIGRLRAQRRRKVDPSAAAGRHPGRRPQNRRCVSSAAGPGSFGARRGATSCSVSTMPVQCGRNRSQTRWASATCSRAPARGLSGGERQRLALARTLARPESVVLLDEPLSAIDARDRPMVAASILSALDGRTAMIVTHDRNEAAMLGDQMAVLVAGRVHQVGPVGDVLRLPADGRGGERPGHHQRPGRRDQPAGTAHSSPSRPQVSTCGAWARARQVMVQWRCSAPRR